MVLCTLGYSQKNKQGKYDSMALVRIFYSMLKLNYVLNIQIYVGSASNMDIGQQSSLCYGTIVQELLQKWTCLYDIQTVEAQKRSSTRDYTVGKNEI